MRIRLEGCEDRSDDADILRAIALGRGGARRAALLAARISDLVTQEAESALLASTMGEVVRAAETLERLLVDDPGREVRLGIFLDRFLSLRSIVACGGSFRLSAVDLPVDFALARAIAYMLCDLINVVERMETVDGLDVKIAIEPEGGRLLIAMSAGGIADGPVSSLAGSRALKRAEHLIHAIGGTLARGVAEGEMLFGIGLQVIDV